MPAKIKIKVNSLDIWMNCHKFNVDSDKISFYYIFHSLLLKLITIMDYHE